MIPQRMALQGSLDYVSGTIINNTVRPECPYATSILNHRCLVVLPAFPLVVLTVASTSNNKARASSSSTGPCLRRLSLHRWLSRACRLLNTTFPKCSPHIAHVWGVDASRYLRDNRVKPLLMALYLSGRTTVCAVSAREDIVGHICRNDDVIRLS